MGKFVKHVSELDVCRLAFEAQQEIFLHSKRFPKEEIYSLTDQIRRSSRSIGANLCEAWAKRRYPAHFSSKLTDADSEREETLHWLATALACKYIVDTCASRITDRLNQIGSMINMMIAHADDWCIAQKSP